MPSIQTRDLFSGKNCSGYRFRIKVNSMFKSPLYLPLEMKSLPQIRQLMQGVSPLTVFKCHSISYARTAFNELRKRYDFDLWAATQYFIPDIKNPDSLVSLRLNDAQHFVIDIMRRRHFDRKRSRYIVTKSFGRCGLTTCIQAYILWMQTFQCSNNSYVCAPADYNLIPLKSNLSRHLGCGSISSAMDIFLPTIGWRAFFNTFENPDAIRGFNLGYVHFSDMSRWHNRRKMSSRAYRASVSAVLLEYFTLVVMEGNIPGRHSFSIKKFVSRHPIEGDPTRTRILSKTFRNPFFINNVLVAQSSPAPYSHLIHIPSSLNPKRPT